MYGIKIKIKNCITLKDNESYDLTIRINQLNFTKTNKFKKQKTTNQRTIFGTKNDLRWSRRIKITIDNFEKI